jgi:AP-2 complex subunit beta-1
VDIDFVRKAVRSIGRITIKVEAAADACIQSLLGLIETKVSYVVQEAIIVIKDIFRRYPGKYEGIIPKLCENLDVLDEPEAKASMVWIIGQFANRIDNADELMDDLTYNFLEEPTEVQFALVTAAVKLFIYKSSSESVKALVHKVLKWTTEEIDNPDLRDRGFMYWRLLAINPTVAGEIVLAEKPAITTDADRMDRGALDQLLLHTGTLSSIYHKNPEVRQLLGLASSTQLTHIFSSPHLAQTFIRGAAGKALIDSPALNPHSRQVIVPVQRDLPISGPVVVAGPGPVEPGTAPAPSPLPTMNTSKPAPPLPGDSAGAGGSLEGEASAGEEDEDEDASFATGKPTVTRQVSTADPYANLGAAFKDTELLF